MRLGTFKMSSSSKGFLVSKPRSLYKYMIAVACLGVTLVVNVESCILGCIFLTSMILIVSTIFLTLFCTQNPKQFIPTHEEEEEKQECSMAKAESEYLDECTGNAAEQAANKEEYMHRALNFLATVLEDESTDNEHYDHCITTSDDDLNVHDINYVARSSLSSEDDDSISDEDTLIELELPTGHYLSPKKHKPKWLELLNIELATEEDNLIEIDISMGSIMCPRFQIEA